MKKPGQALVEIMVGLGITAAIMPAIITAFFATRGGTVQEQLRLQASGRLREAREVMRIVKDHDWSVIADAEDVLTYHLVLNAGVWSLASGPESGLDGRFTRQIIVSPAYRTLTNQLSTIAAGNILDPSVKHINISVSWSDPIASSVSSQYYLMRLESLSYVETLLADFEAPGTIHRSTLATDVSGGEVRLGGTGTGVGDWCNPSLVLQSLDLTRQSVPTSLVAIEGHAYATTGENASGHPLGSIDITNPPAPANPVASESASFNPTPQRKAYGLYADENYIYIASSKDIVNIIDAITMAQVGYFADGNSIGRDVYVSGSVGYASSGSTLYAFSLSGSINPAPLITSTALAGTGRRIKVVGDYVYVVTSSTTKQLQIFNKTTLAEVGTGLNLGNSQGGIDIYVNNVGDYAYIVTSYASPNFFVVQLNGASPPIVVGTYTTSGNMNPRGLTVIEQDARAIVVGAGADSYQVLRINIPSSPTRCDSGLNFSSAGFNVTAINAISSVTEDDGDAYSYILTNDASHEFQMIRGGPGGGGVGSAYTGVFDSQVFEPSARAVFNRFVAGTTLPAGTNLAYQVAVSNKVGGVCPATSYTFVGPDRTTSTWFTGNSSIPLGTTAGYTNPGDCFRYRVSLSTNTLGTTPVLNDFTVYYSP